MPRHFNVPALVRFPQKLARPHADDRRFVVKLNSKPTEEPEEKSAERFHVVRAKVPVLQFYVREKSSVHSFG
jgi:hypothetical protein